MDGFTNISIENILRRYGALLDSVDAWFNRCIEAAGKEISCRSGCSECCCGLFDITLLDACFLKKGFDRLDTALRDEITAAAQLRLTALRTLWPDFNHPFILNTHPEREWDELMPDDDETPCPLLDRDGRCSVYEYRPMTCRLHGLPLVDLSGEILHDEWCTLNFTGADPLKRQELRGEFNRLFRDELVLFRNFTTHLINKRFNELDTFIPTALLIDFSGFDWHQWGIATRIVLNDPIG